MARVLLVEDEANLRDLIADALADFDHQVTVAENGLVALQRLETSEFDVVISDITMPQGVSGIDLAEQVWIRHPLSKVILVSGHARSQLPTLPENVVFVPKPYRIHQLIALMPKT